MTFTRDNIFPLIDRLRQQTGVDFSGYKDSTLRRRITRRMNICQCGDICSYMHLLDQKPEEYINLLQCLTINYSEFFRDPEVFDVIRDSILPDIAAQKPLDKIRIWSAGCANGEEVYSVAVLIMQLQQQGVLRAGAEILGTDIDNAALETAINGCYNKNSLAQMPPETAASWFIDDGKKLMVSDQLKAVVCFNYHNILSPTAASDLAEIRPGKFDLVLFRNVLIYMRRDAQVQALENCTGMLTDGGYLVIGSREIVPKTSSLNLIPVDPRIGIYRKSSVNKDTQEKVYIGVC